MKSVARDKSIASISCLYIVLMIIEFSCSTEVIKIPDDFAIGVGSSSYQIEGAWNVGGKGESSLDVMFRNDTQNGTVAFDFYYKYKEDIQIAKSMGLDHFRLSLSWTRILPTGSIDNINQEGLQFYHNVIDEIRANGMEPFITIYHWDHPKVLDKFNSWFDERMVDFLLDYAKVIFENFGSKVRFWVTINQPNIYCKIIVGKNIHQCGYMMIKAHAALYHLYDKEFRAKQGGKIGIVNACLAHLSEESNNQDCSLIGYEMDCGWVYNPIFSEDGGWSETMKGYIDYMNLKNKDSNTTKIILPSFTPEEIEYIKGTSDFFGLNYYSSVLCKPTPNSNSSIFDYSTYGNDTWKKGPGKFPVYNVPEGLRFLLNTIKNNYNNPTVYILENGFPSNLGFNDIERINYLYLHMKTAILAREVDGCNVEKYIVWSFLDGFEWLSGYDTKMGLVEVDLNSPNRTRIPRLSAKWLQKIMKDRKLVNYSEDMDL